MSAPIDLSRAGLAAMRSNTYLAAADLFVPRFIIAAIDRIIALEDERTALATAVTERLHAETGSTARPDETVYWHDARSIALQSVFEAITAPAPGSEIADEDDLIDLIEGAIDGSMDQDWRCRDGARAAAAVLIEANAVRFGPPADANDAEPPK